MAITNENYAKMFVLFNKMMNEKTVFVTGEFLNTEWDVDTYDKDKLYEVQVTGISADETVNLFYTEGDAYCEDINDVDIKEINLFEY